MRNAYYLFVAIFTILIAAEVSASSDFQSSGGQNTPIVSQRNTPPKKFKSQKPKKHNVSPKKISVPSKKNILPKRNVTPQKSKGPAIKLEFPADGMEVRGDGGVMLEGTIDDPGIESAILLLNNVPVPIKVQNGHFFRKIFLPGRLTTFKVTAKDKSGATGYSELHKVYYVRGGNLQPSMGGGPPL